MPGFRVTWRRWPDSVALTVSDFEEALAFIVTHSGWTRSPTGTRTMDGRRPQRGPRYLELFDEAQAEIVDRMRPGSRFGDRSARARSGGQRVRPPGSSRGGRRRSGAAVTTPWGDRNAPLRRQTGCNSRCSRLHGNGAEIARASARSSTSVYLIVRRRGSRVVRVVAHRPDEARRDRRKRCRRWCSAVQHHTHPPVADAAISDATDGLARSPDRSLTIFAAERTISGDAVSTRCSSAVALEPTAQPRRDERGIRARLRRPMICSSQPGRPPKAVRPTGTRVGQGTRVPDGFGRRHTHRD